MTNTYYPWGGEFTVCKENGCIAVVLLNIEYAPCDSVAIYGHLKTENIGIEKIVANVISNPHIRYVLVCGHEIRGHHSGQSLICLHSHGIDENHRIINASGAIPYIENLNVEAIHRFQSQVEIIDCLGITNKETLDSTIDSYLKKSSSCFGEPYIAIQIKPDAMTLIDDKRALHSKIIVNYMGKVSKRSQ
ncbi:MAG: methyltransferase [Thermoplasmatota archaeon]